jgi:hypothetical protein
LVGTPGDTPDLYEKTVPACYIGSQDAR